MLTPLVLPLWALLAFAFSFAGALIIGYNQWAQIDGRHLTLHRYAGVLVLAVLLLPFVQLPTNPQFYGIAALMGVVLSGSDILLANAAHKHGGRLTALYIPIKMFMLFLIWLVLDSAERTFLLTNPLHAAGIFACLGACAWSLSHMRRSDASWAALQAIIPVAALLTLADIGAKYLLESPSPAFATLVGGAVAWMLMSGATASLISAALLWHRQEKLALPRRAWLQAAGFGVLLMAGICVLLSSIALSPNPGYVAAITMLSAVWLSIWAFFKKHEHTNPLASLTLIAAAFLLTLLTH